MIKKFEEFINEGIIMKTIKRSLGNGIRKEDDIVIQLIQDFMERHSITDYNINPDKSVDVNGNIRINNKDLIDGKIPFKFGKVTGSFYCDYNQLTSLEGCPKKVGSSFYCTYNKLTSLKGCPEEVGGSFNCYNNNLTSLEGCPKIIKGNFNCSTNKLTSLKGCPEEVGGNFMCHNNYIQFTKDDVKSICNVKLKIIV